MGRTGRGRSAPAHLGYCDGDEGGPRRRLRADPFGLRAHPLRPPRQRDQPGTRALEAGGPLSWGEGLALTADRDMLADEPEPSRAPNHLPSRHDDGAATAELHQVDLLIAGAEQQEVRDPKVEHLRPRTPRATFSSTSRLARGEAVHRPGVNAVDAGTRGAPHRLASRAKARGLGHRGVRDRPPCSRRSSPSRRASLIAPSPPATAPARAARVGSVAQPIGNTR